MSKLSTSVAELTDMNDHTEARILITKYLLKVAGTSELKETATLLLSDFLSIQTEQDRAGYLPEYLNYERNQLDGTMATLGRKILGNDYDELRRSL